MKFFKNNQAANAFYIAATCSVSYLAVYLAKNIKMDKNYKSVLGYTEQQMITLITNNNNLVYSGTDLSFIRVLYCSTVIKPEFEPTSHTKTKHLSSG